MKGGLKIMIEDFAVEINDVTKKFGQNIAVDHVSLKIKRGEIFGLLGPNGAGKTTTLRMITTLLEPTSGSIQIFGHDVQEEQQLVRSLFGLTGQYASVDEDISARENLMIFARLNGLSRSEAKQRTIELLEEFSLVNAANKSISNFSGGMRRRLDLAVSLITRPALIFLDEPTTGLDPRTRTQMWMTIRQLVAAGSTIVLTTQYLEEADELADRIAVIDQGKLIRVGTPDELKNQVGGAKLKIELADEKQIAGTIKIMEKLLEATPYSSHKIIEVAVENIDVVGTLLQKLTNSGIELTNISVSQPTMDEVFLAFTVDGN